MDQNINVNVRSFGDNRGRSFLIGLFVLWLLLRWWLGGTLFSVAQFATAKDVPSEGFQGYESATAVAVKIGVDIIVAVGTIATALFSGLWAVAYAFVSELWTMIRNRSQVASATTAATDAAVASATATAVRSAVLDEATAKLIHQLPKAFASINALHNRVKTLETPPEPDLFSSPAPVPAPRAAPKKAAPKRASKSKTANDGGAQ